MNGSPQGAPKKAPTSVIPVNKPKLNHSQTSPNLTQTTGDRQNGKFVKGPPKFSNAPLGKSPTGKFPKGPPKIGKAPAKIGSAPPKQQMTQTTSMRELPMPQKKPESQRDSFRLNIDLKDSSLGLSNDFISGSNDKENKVDAPTDRVTAALNNKLFQRVEVACNDKRDNIANELLTTEQSYLRSLTLMNEVFRLPMLEAAKKGDFPCDEDKIHEIFSKNFTDILKVNFVLLQGLHERLSKWSSTQVLGDLLLDLMPFLKMYTLYTGGWEKASSLLDELESKDSYTNFVTQCMQKHENLQDLRAYLIMPIQRIPRYRLLLEDLAKSTPQNHPDYEGVTKSLDKVLVIAKEVDQAIIEHKNRARLLQIQKKFLENVQIIEAGRYLIKEGELTKICRKDNKKFAFWLFSDLLLYAKEMPGNRYTRNRSFPLVSVSVSDIKDDSSKKLANAFQIASSKKSFIVYTSTPEEKESWLKEIHQCLEIIDERLKTFQDKSKVRDVSTLAPVWVPDSLSHTCYICGSKFTFIVRKHHCRQCGHVICGKCSSRKKELPGRGKKRVCDECYDKPVTDVPSHSQNQTLTQSIDSIDNGKTEVLGTFVVCNLDILHSIFKLSIRHFLIMRLTRTQPQRELI